jgi:hypothetical protein
MTQPATGNQQPATRPCRACGRPLRFVKHIDGQGGRLEELKVEGVYVTHFATCPQAGQFSAGTKARSHEGTK